MLLPDPDGVLRISAGDQQSYAEDGGEWFMDYRNADGSVAEMCSNGTRVFARYLADHGLTTGKQVRSERRTRVAHGPALRAPLSWVVAEGDTT